MEGDFEGKESADDCETLLEKLRSQKRVCKMQLTKLYSHLLRLVSREVTDIEELLTALEATQEKNLDVSQVLEDLIVIYQSKGDEQSLKRAEAEMEKVTTDTDREIATVKEFLTSLTLKTSPMSEATEFQGNPLEEKAPKSNVTGGISVGHVDKNLERIKLPKFNGDKTKFENFWATFESIVDETDEPAKYKMIRLKSCLEGKAEEAISRLGFSKEAYEEAKNTLKRRFGGERRQLQNYLEEIKKIRPLQEGNIQELEKFADILVSTVITLREHNRESELEPGSLLFSLVVEKIPKTMLSRYFRWAFESHRLESLQTLRDWMVEESEYQIKATESTEGLGAKGRQREDDRKKNRAFSTLRVRGHPQFQRRCDFCEGNHGIWTCPRFREESVEERWRVAKDKKLCFRCLSGNHQGKHCFRSRDCGVDGCNRSHHKLLHLSEDVTNRVASVGDANISNISSPSQRVIACENTAGNTEQGPEERSQITTLTSAQYKEVVSLRTVPVWLKSKGKKIKVNAVLDDASTISYVNEEVAGALGLSATYEKVSVNVLNENVETFDSMPVSLTLESCDGNVKIPFQALTCPRRVTGTYKIVDWQKYQSRWPHLSVCKFPDPAADPMVDLLIGQDQIDLHFSKCDVKGDPGEPVARLGPLGWSCIGHPDRRTIAKEIQTNLAYTLFCRPRVFDEINDSLKRFWEIETLGTQKSKPCIMTVEEKIAFEKVNQSLVHDGERYQVAVPWKSDCPTLPNNFEMACSRLKNTEKRLLRQPIVGQEYNQIIASYLDKGYIHKIKETDKEPPIVWYLPHFPVCRPERMTTKTRIVFDASAKFQGTSLNEELYAGPKLQNSLFDVLLRFRRFPVAVACDVSEMYLQIRIPIEDRSKFRFLWRNLEVDRKPDIYEFERVVFGDASAPFRAQFVSQENARIYQKEFPHASTTVCKSTYMDDSLDSVRDNQTAIQLFEELQGLWAKAGMKARKWLSNSPEVLTKIPQELRAYEINLKDSLPTAKTLGILWRAQQDVLTFQAKKLPEEDKLTKRIILSKVAGVFDPLGLAGPFVVCAKILLQEMWTKGLDWDEPIDHELSSRQVIGKHSSRQVIEKHGVGNMNSNGLMVLEFCSRYQLCVMGTMFQMKKV